MPTQAELEHAQKQKKINMKEADLKAKAINDIKAAKTLEAKKNGLASYFSTQRSADISNNHIDDLSEKEITQIFNGNGSRGQFTRNIGESPAFKDITKNLTEDDFIKISEEADLKKHDTLDRLYSKYANSSLKKAKDPEYKLLTAEDKKKQASANAAAKKQADKIAAENSKKKAAEEAKKAKEKAKRDKEEAKKKAAEEKKRLKEEAKKAKEEAKKKAAEEKKRQKEEAKKAKEEAKKKAAEKKAKEAKEKAELKAKKAAEKKQPKKGKPAKAKAEPVKEAQAKQEPEKDVYSNAQINRLLTGYINEANSSTFGKFKSEKEKLAFDLQVEQTRKELTSKGNVTKIPPMGELINSSKELAKTDKFNKYAESLGADRIHEIVSIDGETKDLAAEYEAFVPEVTKQQEEKTVDPHQADIAHYTESIEKNIANQCRKIDDAFKNPDMSQAERKNVCERSLANIMTNQAMLGQLETNGDKMTKSDMQALCNNTNARKIRDGVLKDPSFKTLCDNMTRDDYLSIAKNENVKEVISDCRQKSLVADDPQKTAEKTAPEKNAASNQKSL